MASTPPFIIHENDHCVKYVYWHIKLIENIELLESSFLNLIFLIFAMLKGEE